MDLNEVLVFIKVVQAGSFSQAALQLGMPNSTVSSKVSSLEARLGLTLIRRTTRRLNVTPAGQAYFKKCVQGLEEIYSAENELLASEGEPQGRLRLTAPMDLGSHILPNLISDFSKKFSKVNLDILLTDRRVDLLAENMDLAIRAGELKDSSLKAKKLGAIYFSIFAAPKYLKAHGVPSHPKELRQHQCLHFTSMGSESWKLASPKGLTEFPIMSRVLINDLNLIKTLVCNGDGLALLPAFSCFPELQQGKLVHVLTEWRSQTTPVHFVYPAQKYTAPKVSAFIEFSTDILKKNLSQPNLLP